MLLENDTEIPILYTVVGGGVAHGTILPGGRAEIDSTGVLNLSLTSDDGSPMPSAMAVRISMRSQ